MGMMGQVFGLGAAARQVGEAATGFAEVFAGNRAKREVADHERFLDSLTQFTEEFRGSGSGWFDSAVNGLNRLPRPMMAIGTLGLFTYSMVDPAGFATRMQGLGYVPEPLWWLLGAVVSFYFGARELHHYRGRQLTLREPPQTAERTEFLAAQFTPTQAPKAANATVPADKAEDPNFNAAYEEWRTLNAA